MEILNDRTISMICGGTAESKRENLCAEVQEMASRHGSEWNDKQWDEWGELYDIACSGK